MIVLSSLLKRHRRRRAALLAILALAGCHRSTVAAIPVTAPDGTPAMPPPAATHAPDSSRALVRRGYTAADVRFMHHMLLHHAQALVMTALVPSRSARADVQLVAERIAISQRDETALMERWLRARGESVPSAAGHGHHGGHGAHGGMASGDSAHTAMMASMPGMIAPAELRQLEAATGAAFDTLFVRLMIRHHEGALTMVRDYLATPGAAQEPAIFRFASDVDADQRAEIRRLRSLVPQ
jgi:uncharacterized protein (DUF305 family)